MKLWTAEDWESEYPGALDALEAAGVSISNNAGAIMVDGYLGDIALTLVAHGLS